MSRARYQRDAGGSHQQAGMIDGWHRPPGPAPPGEVGKGWDGSLADGRALRARYVALWFMPRPARRLRGRFDSVASAVEYAAVVEVDLGGVWDTRLRRWAL